MSKPKDSKNLPERSLFLFRSLVQHFINNGGHPVGSRSLVNDLDLSAATIRNIMADLEDMGLLSSPYVSSGRVPTNLGYRLFVDNLLRVNILNDEEIQQINDEIGSGDKKSVLQRTSAMLSRITSLASVVMLPRIEQSKLNHIEFLKLSGNRILVILMMSNNDIQNRIIHTTKSFASAELEQSANYLNQLFSGKELVDIRKEILTELETMKDNINQLMQSAIEIAQQVTHPEIDNDYVITGETNLMDVLEWNEDNMGELKRLFEAFNEKQDILHLLEKSIHANGIQLFIGEESGYDVLNNYSVVTSPYESEGQILGVLGVIGPTHMNYERVIPIVDLTARMLGSVLNSE